MRHAALSFKKVFPMPYALCSMLSVSLRNRMVPLRFNNIRINFDVLKEIIGRSYAWFFADNIKLHFRGDPLFQFDSEGVKLFHPGLYVHAILELHNHIGWLRDIRFNRTLECGLPSCFADKVTKFLKNVSHLRCIPATYSYPSQPF